LKEGNRFASGNIVFRHEEKRVFNISVGQHMKIDRDIGDGETVIIEWLG